ncbi:hypothetical protein C1E24_14060 [Pseudoalteromonas phenolica]|uniref:Uncharacterized protein n=1 Tax=Pseudoalteromonas phenolica TaxID=161398 RepID=A0A5R9Q0Y2_9GAMM|nr:hypothetical protein [Pseudoalteromonas phenolica]TLX46484.1 hypothetical protein C1E24_14060 [Pseudoalteromonas phenolica]
MQKNKIVVGLVAISCISIWYFLGSKQNIVNRSHTAIKTANVINQVDEMESSQETIPETNKPMPTSFDQSVVESAKIIATKYEQTLKFPPYSHPLSLNDFSLLNPNYFEPVTMVTQDNNVKISMVLNKYHFVAPETIKVLVKGSDIYGVKLKVQNADTRKTLSSYTMQHSQDGYITKIRGDSEYPTNLQITALANVNGDEIPLVAQINYNQKSATIIGGSQPYVEEADLVFPIDINVEESGLYRVRANLFSAGKPLASLVTETRLASGNKQAMLKAHQSVLSNSSQYELTTFTIEKRSTHPAEPSRFGKSEIQKLIFQSIDITTIERTAYVPSENEKKRLSFLKNMTNKG